MRYLLLLLAGCTVQLPDLGAGDACDAAVDAWLTKRVECGMEAVGEDRLTGARGQCAEARPGSKEYFERCKVNYDTMTCEELFVTERCDPAETRGAR